MWRLLLVYFIKWLKINPELNNIYGFQLTKMRENEKNPEINFV